MLSRAGAPSRRRAGRRGDVADSQVFGAVLVLAGVLLLLMRAGAVTLSWQAVVSSLLVVLGLGMLVTVRRPTGPLLIVAGAVMTLVLLSASSIDVGVLNAGVGERSFRALTVADATATDRLAIGQITADLSDLDVPVGATSLTYDVGVGEIVVILPADTDIGVRVSGAIRAGEIDVLGRTASGTDARRVVKSPGYDAAERRLDLRVGAGFGNVKVTRADA